MDGCSGAAVGRQWSAVVGVGRFASTTSRGLRERERTGRGQSVEVDLPYPLPPVQGDAPRLTQVFVNLLVNAAQALEAARAAS